MGSLVTPHCPSCELREVREIGALPETNIFAGREVDDVFPASSLFRCAGCGLMFRHPTLTACAYDALYGKVSLDSWSSGSARVDWALIEEYLARACAPGDRVLDFGCHTGGLLQQIGPSYSRTGVEINPRAAKVAREALGIDVFPSLASLPAGKHFDVATAVDIVEHFADPGRAIASLLEVVKPGGVLIVTTGDAHAWLWRIAGPRWWYCYYPEHLAFISERWIRGWLRRTGARADVAEARRFRYLRLSPARYVRQACLVSAYLASPRTYAWAMRHLKRLLGRPGGVEPSGIGLSKDHLFLVIRKQP